jgi:antitoxin CptB
MAARIASASSRPYIARLAMTDASTDRDLRLKKLKFRAWRRGFREADFILGAFADAQIETLSPGELDAFETLLEQPDQPLYAWIIGAEPIPVAFDHEVMGKIRTFLPNTYVTVRAGG